MAKSLLEKDILEYVEQFAGSHGFNVLPLAGDASTRRYFRIIVGTQTYVLMVWEPFNKENFPFLSVQEHFNKNGVHVPEVNSFDENKGVMILEDLGDLTLERKFWENQDQSMVLPFYQQAIEEILKVHYKCSADTDHDCTAFHIQFDHDKLLWEMNYGLTHLVEGLLGIQLKDSEKRKIQGEFSEICKTLDDEPKFIAHRDYHSRNLMLHFGKMRVIDFQDARMGPIQYDLVSLVYDSYVDLSETSKNLILSEYLTRAKDEYDQKIDMDHFYDRLSYQIIQRCFKACGSFSSFYNTREDRRYLGYLQGTLKTVDEELKKLDKYSGFTQLFNDHNLCDQDYEELCKP